MNQTITGVTLASASTMNLWRVWHLDLPSRSAAPAELIPTVAGSKTRSAATRSLDQGQVVTDSDTNLIAEWLPGSAR